VRQQPHSEECARLNYSGSGFSSESEPVRLCRVRDWPLQRRLAHICHSLPRHIIPVGAALSFARSCMVKIEP
jgi:hypothetical protein